MMAGGLLLAVLLTAGALQAQPLRPEEEGKGEDLLRQARVDLAEANRLSEAAIQATQAAQRDQEAGKLAPSET